MQLHLVAVGQRMPSWVTEGYNDYAQRLRGDHPLSLHEVAASKRGRNPETVRVLREEAQRLDRAAPANARRVALAVAGRTLSTEALSACLADWGRDGRALALFIGGPEGLDPTFEAACDARWSLSAMTLPHPLVRVIVAEQLYRAVSVLRGHPYHRGA
ncbi:MAG: 23S rRNA (pseudouridine(1915)-N(3))-methyltransferase RlmH [Pseudomonadota bacterium]